MELTDNIACKFWMDHFDKTKEVATPYFLSIFSNFIQEYAKIALDESQINHIQFLIDPMNSGSFILQQKQEQKLEFELDNLVIRFLITPENCYNYLKLPNNLQITPKYIILSGGTAKKKSLQQQNLLTIGASKTNDIEINDCESLNSNSIQISFLKDCYLIKDVGTSQRSRLLVTTKPLILDKDMIIYLGLCEFKVCEVTPDALYSRTETSQKLKTKYINIDYNLAYFNQLCSETKFSTVENYYKWNQEKEVSSMKYNVLKSRKVALECIKGKDKGKILEFSLNSELKRQEFSIGRGQLCQGRLEDMSIRLNQCILVFSLEIGWYLVSDKDEYQEFGTWVSMASIEEVIQRRESNLHIMWGKAVVELEKEVIIELVPTIRKIEKEEEK